MDRIEAFGRIVLPITSIEGQEHYYDYMNTWNSCVVNNNERIRPTREQAEDYMRLREENPSLFGDIQERNRYEKLQVYENRYDWRPIKSGEKHSVGLVSPSGEELLPNIFEDVFTCFNSMTGNQKIVPVYNGEAWALATLDKSPVLITDFRYNAIVPERWERNIFFVQDVETMKWGALRKMWSRTNCMLRSGHRLMTLEEVMPCIADEIYEDELLVEDPEEMPSLFFMTRVEDKVGILTDFGYSPIIFDTYEADTDDCSYRLIRKDRNEIVKADWWHPDGKIGTR